MSATNPRASRRDFLRSTAAVGDDEGVGVADAREQAEDGGIENARTFILKVLGPAIDEANAEHSQGNYKSLLQQYAQDKFNATPVYLLLDEKGPDHNKCFELGVSIAGRVFPSAWGTNKKEAEQKAAYNTLVELGAIEKTEQEDEKS